MNGGSARLFYVMGPSGAGKDTLLRHARARLADRPVCFAHRYITRPTFAGGEDENFISLSVAEFDRRRAHDLFLFTWAARGVAYGIGREVADWLAAGLDVVVSGSRAHFAGGAPADIAARPIVITAAPDLIATRLTGRGREDAAERADRLARGDALADLPQGAIVIDNSGPLDIAVARLVAVLDHPRGAV